MLRNRNICAAIALAAFVWLGNTTPVAAQDDNTQASALYKLQAAFHRFGSVQDPVNGDSPEVITGRIRDMLSLWTSDGIVYLNVGGARDGYYIGNGDPEDASTCPTISADPNNRGTLCTFFKYVAGSFQAANKLVSLAPAYKTAFDVDGRTATFYFECHYFNVGIDSGTGKPLWTAASHFTFNGSTRKVEGHWLFSLGIAGIAPVPVP